MRPAPKDMEDHFRKEAKRTVARDRTFSLTGKLYEAPGDLVGKQVRLLYHEHDPARIEIRFGDKTYGFASVIDMNVNCRVKRRTASRRLIRRYAGKIQRGKSFNNTGKEADGI